MAAFMLVELLSDAPDDPENWRIAKSLAIIIAAFQAQLPPAVTFFNSGIHQSFGLLRRRVTGLASVHSNQITDMWKDWKHSLDTLIQGCRARPMDDHCFPANRTNLPASVSEPSWICTGIPVAVTIKS
jgi:hypothetical protein